MLPQVFDTLLYITKEIDKVIPVDVYAYQDAHKTRTNCDGVMKLQELSKKQNL
jgi:NADH:ubiquinone oxidoreductase subunit B-like Fe-S oxidoreductase